jgi:hypothetical protein
MIRLLWIRKMADAGIALDDDALFDAWDTLPLPPPMTARTRPDLSSGSGRLTDSMSVLEAAGKMPYDFSPARLRCRELAEDLSAQEPPLPATRPAVQVRALGEAHVPESEGPSPGIAPGSTYRPGPSVKTIAAGHWCQTDGGTG